MAAAKARLAEANRIVIRVEAIRRHAKEGVDVLQSRLASAEQVVENRVYELQRLLASETQQKAVRYRAWREVRAPLD